MCGEDCKVQIQGNTFILKIEVEPPLSETIDSEYLSVELCDFRGKTFAVDFSLVDNYIYVKMQGTVTEKMPKGWYSLIVWYRKGLEDQTAARVSNVFRLIDATP